MTVMGMVMGPDLDLFAKVDLSVSCIPTRVADAEPGTLRRGACCCAKSVNEPAEPMLSRAR